MSAETITLALGGKWHGRYGTAMCPAHDNKNTPALSVSDGEWGKLLVTCHAGCDPVDVLRAINGRGLGMEDIHPHPCRSHPSPKPDKGEEGRSNYALKIWRDALPIQDSIVERYLRERAIRAPFPETLRFHRSIRHPETRQVYPGMIGIITFGEDNTPVAIHRTFLAPDACKAMVMPNKMMLGKSGGGAVRLQDAGGGPLVVCEGIETGLSIRDELGAGTDAPRVWAAMSTSGIKRLTLPSSVGELVIAPDGDAPGRAAADKLARRARSIGWHVSIMDAPDGRDWNDVARDQLCEVGV